MSNLDRVYVTPELGFEYILSTGKKSFDIQEWNAILRKMYKSDLLNIEVPLHVMVDAISKIKGELAVKDAIDIILGEHLKFRGVENDFDWIVVKNGRHMRYLNQIMDIFSKKSVFLHVYRDPRAVVSSKLSSIRPYFPKEKMAWGGVILAALRWRSYIRKVLLVGPLGGRLLEIKYEDFVTKPELDLERISDFLGVDRVDTCLSYSVPAMERGVHELVEQKEIKVDRVNGWKQSLPSGDQIKIEVLCGKEMSALGYPFWRRNRLLGWMLIALDIPNTCWKVLRHYAYMIWVRKLMKQSKLRSDV